MSPSYRPDIDGLRAVSIAAVVAFHAAPDVLRGGFVGVDVFFVISGFLITGIILRELRQGTFTLAGFYGRRVRRIVPALVLVLACSLAAGWLLLFPIEYRALGKHTGAAAVFLSNAALLAESGYFDAASETKPLLHLWSLAVEEQYYLLWPVLLIVLWRFRSRTLWFACLGFAVSLALCIVQTRTHPVKAFFLPSTRIWEILAGSLLAMAAPGRAALAEGALIRPASLAHAASVLGLGGIVLSAVLLTSGGARFPGWQALLPVLSAVLLLAAGPGAIVNRTLLSHPWVVALGLVSFPLYLWHWPLLVFARIVESDVPSWSVRLAAVLVALLLAVATYRLIERPIRVRQLSLGQGLGLLAALAVVGTAGAGIYLGNGVPDRAAISPFAHNERELVRLPERDADCLARIGTRNPVFPYCRYTAAGEATVAVIGDSHAHVAYPGIAEVLASRGVGTILLANSGCPTFLGGEYGPTAAEREACRDRIDAIIGVVLHDSAIHDVMIFSRGPLYLSGLGYGFAERDRTGPPMIEPARFAQALQHTVDVLTAAGKRVVYVLENPETGLDPRRCIDRPLREARPCGVDQSAVLQRQPGYRDLVGGLRGVTVVDPLPAFCEGGSCGLLDQDGTLLYADDNHLSVAGSMRQARRALSDVLAAAGSPGPPPHGQ